MYRITLFAHENSGIRITMVVFFNEKNQLVFEGYDIGSAVDDFWGDSD